MGWPRAVSAAPLRHHGPVADTQPYRPRKRGYESIKDMMWSLIPIVIAVIAFVYFCGPTEDQVTTVDPQVDISSAAREVDYALVAPAMLGEQWKATSSVLLRDDDDKVTGLSIGYLTPDGATARYVISSGSRDSVLDQALANAKVVTDPDGEPVELGGLPWVPVSTSAGRAMVAEGDGFVAVVAGTAAYAELRELAGSVQAPE